MNVKKWLLAGLLSFVVLCGLSYLWFMVLMQGFYETNFANLMAEDPNVMIIGIGYLILTFGMAYMYPHGYKGGSPIMEGLRFGVLIGILAYLSQNVILSEAQDFTLKAGLVDSVYHIVEKGIGGIVIGLVYGTGAAKAS